MHCSNCSEEITRTQTNTYIHRNGIAACMDFNGFAQAAPGTPSIDERIFHAQHAIGKYSRIKTGERGLYDDQEIVIVDLLADLMHLAARNELFFDDMVKTAQAHFEHENDSLSF